jgi:hypothetical protein
VLRAALPALPLGGGRKPSAEVVAAAVERAQASFEYQSNGGVLLSLAVPFAELSRPAGRDPAKERGRGGEVALVAASVPLAAAPTLVLGKHEVATAAARYELGEPPAAAMAVKPDKQGRLLLHRRLAPTRWPARAWWSI